MTAAARSSGAVIDLAFQLRRPSCGRAVKILAAGSQWTRRWREAGFEPSVPRGAIKVSRGAHLVFVRFPASGKVGANDNRYYDDAGRLPRDRSFESCSLQRRVCEPSVPFSKAPARRRSSSRPRSTAPTRLVRFNAWQFRQTLGRSVYGMLLCQTESAAAVRAFVESCRYPHQPAGVDPSLPSPAERLRGATGEPGEGRLGIGTRGARCAETTATPIWGCRRKNTCSAATPGRSTRTASCCSASPRRDCDRAGQSGLVLGR